MAKDRDALFQKKTQALVSLSVGFIFIFIGIPLWWNTTKVYRASLPYSQIEELNHLKVLYSTHINVILLGDQDSDVLKEEIEKGLNKGEELSTTVAEYRVTVLKKSCEDALLHSLKISSLEDLDEYFLTSSLLNMDGQHYSFIVLPHNHPDSSTVDLFVGKYLHCIMYDNKDLRKLASTISRVTKNVYVNEVAVSRAFSLASNRQVTSVKDTPESMRGQKSTTGFQVSFTLLNSDPQSVIPEWDIEAAIQKYLDPFLQKFPHLDISVDSQVLHYSSVKITPKKSGETFYLPYDDLPHMINPIEAKLGSHISLYPSLNFIVYIPAQGQSPLYMRTKDDEKSATNAFLSPQWGGLMIYNVQKAAEGDNSTQHITVNMKSVMSVFISQLKLLLGVLPVEPEEGVLIRHGRDVGVTRWEQDMVMRVKTMEYLATSTITLTSLAQLLSEISNMVINDNIQQQVEQALHAIYQSTAALRRGDLSRAVFTARKAIKSSEEAFFDPSILELLYFPDDQKYAIYIPLFLPIGLPILLSLRQAINWYRGKTDSEDDTDKQKSKEQ